MKIITKKITAVLCAVSMTLPVVGNAPVLAEQTPEIIDLGQQEQYQGRTEENVKSRWVKARDERSSEKVYAVEPNASSAAAASAGAIRPEAKETLANYVNFNRWLAGMDDLKIAEDNVWKAADEVAVVCQLNKTVSHYPEKPAGMNEEFYQRAYSGAQHSNLDYQYYSWIPKSFETLGQAKTAIDGWFSDNTNIVSGAPVGHREMMLWRSSYSFAFGATDCYAAFYRNSGWLEPTTNHALAYTWPAPGPVPLAISEVVYWSCSLNPDQFEFVSPKGAATVTIKELNSGEVLKSMKCDDLTYQYSYIDSGIGLSKGWYGDATLFYKVPWDLHAGENYQVEITGLKRKSNGRPVTLSYTVSPFAEEAVMNRLYNTNSGEHFYTADQNEKDFLIGLGWKDEGIGWVAPKWSDTPVYRLYNPNAGDHHYTMNPDEKDGLIRAGWRDEGVGWYSDDAKRIPLYRQYNPNAAAGSHNYTVEKQESDYLCARGWQYEGISWYALSER